MQEKFNNFQQEIQQLNEEAEKNKRNYGINRRADEYANRDQRKQELQYSYQIK